MVVVAFVLWPDSFLAACVALAQTRLLRRQGMAGAHGGLSCEDVIIGLRPRLDVGRCRLRHGPTSSRGGGEWWGNGGTEAVCCVFATLCRV